MAFVGAEIAGSSWATLVNRDWLDQREETVIVTLRRQSPPVPTALSGWIIFC
jgi:hypothetical protein